MPTNMPANMTEVSANVYFLIVGAVIALVLAFLVFKKRRDKRAGQIRPQGHEVSRPESKTEIKSTIAAQPQIAVTDRDRVFKGLSKTKSFLQKTIDSIFTEGQGAKFFDAMEESLLTADVGIELAEKIVTNVKAGMGIKTPARDELKNALTRSMTALMPTDREFKPTHTPQIIMVVGVNGAGKTTTIAKLCERYRKQNKKVLVGAADTFRAAATAQLKTWVERTGAEGVFQPEGSDPSAVAFDTVQAAASRKTDICIIDTAGRLHTKSNLMDELKKMKRVVNKAMTESHMPSEALEVWLVLDGTMGQNAMNQAREFNQSLGLTGLVVTKLDGSAKGGALVAISSELNVPVIFIGVGESPEDLVEFKKDAFVEAILAGI